MCAAAPGAAIVRCHMSDNPNPPPSGDPWVPFGYLVGGAAFYGGLGWLLDRWLHTAFWLPIGLFVGIGLALYLIFKLYLNA